MRESSERISYSSFLVLLPPYASPELQSSRFAYTPTLPPSSLDMRGSAWIGDAPNKKDSLGMLASGSGTKKSSMFPVTKDLNLFVQDVSCE